MALPARSRAMPLMTSTPPPTPPFSGIERVWGATPQNETVRRSTGRLRADLRDQQEQLHRLGGLTMIRSRCAPGAGGRS